MCHIFRLEMHGSNFLLKFSTVQLAGARLVEGSLAGYSFCLILLANKFELLIA
jgi:hypothetical protein